MRVTQNIHEFFRQTAIIWERERLAELGLTTDDPFGIIRPDEIEDVRAFCERNPSFHIVSYVGEGIFLNKYDERSRVLYLAEGDDDPTYVLDSKHLHDWVFASLSDGVLLPGLQKKAPRP